MPLGNAPATLGIPPGAERLGFLGRGKQDLHWSLLLSGLKVAIIHGKLCFIIFLHAHIFFLIQLLQLSKAVMWS